MGAQQGWGESVRRSPGCLSGVCISHQKGVGEM